MLPLLCLVFLLTNALNETCFCQKKLVFKTAVSTLLPKAEIHSTILVTITCSSSHCLIAKLLAIISVLQ